MWRAATRRSTFSESNTDTTEYQAWPSANHSPPDAFLEPHVREFDITGKPMKGWVMVEPEGVVEDERLNEWIERATKFVKTLQKK
jgi:hypothetical protein